MKSVCIPGISLISNLIKLLSFVLLNPRNSCLYLEFNGYVTLNSELCPIESLKAVSIVGIFFGTCLN